MRQPIFLILIALAVVAAGAGLFLGIRGSPVTYQPPQRQLPAYGAITPPPYPPTSFFQAPPAQARGMVLVDQAHFNAFQATELHSLTTLILSRGFSLAYLERAGEQEEKLRQADALVVISPQLAYSPEEVVEVRRFVGQGGKLLLLADPARLGEINSLAREFGITYEEDYLYNLKENVGNFRYIVLKDFQEHPLTQGVKSLGLYIAGSLSSQGQGLAFGDDNTRSSLFQDRNKPSPVALAPRALGIHDLSFLGEPYMTTLDNSRFIANIAQWLTQSERVFLLTDFPHFFQDTLTVGYAEPSLWDMAQGLRDFFLGKNKRPELAGYEKAPPRGQDLLLLGLFRHSQAVKEYLEKGNITIALTGEIQGRVVDSKTEEPVEGGMVSVLSGEVTFDTAVKGDGSFTLSHLSPGSYELTASGKGHREKRATVRLGEGEKVEQAFSLIPLGVGEVRGCAKDKDTNKPIKGAEVTVEGTDYRATTQEDGCYQLKGVWEGAYQLSARAEGYKPLSQEVKVVAEGSLTADFPLSPGEAEKVEVKRGSLQGKIKDADSQEAIARAEVVVRGTKFSTSTDSRGAYSLKDLTPGTYQLTARAEGYKPLTKKVRVAAEDKVTVDFDLITPLKLEIKGVGQLPQQGTALLYLSPGPGPRVLLCLADTEETLRKALALLQGGGFRKWLVRDNLAIYQVGS